jgi:hypothetical protein
MLLLHCYKRIRESRMETGGPMLKDSGLYRYVPDTNERRVYGVHAYGASENSGSGTRIDEKRYPVLEGWIGD